MRHRWLPAAAVALAAMTLVLLASWWNRSGGRRDIVLTERETELVQGQDGRGIVLVFNEPPAEAGNRITVAKLAALGADTTGSTMSVALGGGLHGYAVFELGGLVWRRNAELAIREYVAAVVAPDTVPERQDSLLNDFRRTQEERVTRLVLADAGIDAEALAREYDDPAKYLILPADLAIQRRFRAGPG
ncbi:MAG TPA: DUF4824 family protein, partial [Gemmatimonadales bacterium]|nr:DUF4824 family protein [Gemmatimonadales bacterium]